MNIKPTSWIVVDKHGRRLCKDKRFRDIAWLGTFPENLKFFRYKKSAVKYLTNEGRRVIPLYKNDEIDACGKIYRKNQ